MSTLDELFNMDRSAESISTEPAKKAADANLYTINLKDAVDGVYKSKIRFIPNIRNVKESIITKFTYWLTEADGSNGIYVDDPSTIGEKSPIGEMYWKLKNSKNPVEVNLADNLKRGRKFFSLIQVIEDQQHPELEGKLMAFGYGFKIKEKIDSELKDEDDGSNPFDLLNGRVFRLEVKTVGGYQNYDSCKFVGGNTPISIDGKKMTENDKQKIVKFLETSPELDDYKFKEWTAEQHDSVMTRLDTYKQGYSKTSAKVEHAISQEDEDFTEEREVKSNSKKTASSSDDDDFLDGIDL